MINHRDANQAEHPDVQHAPDFATVRWNGHTFYFSGAQRRVVQLLLRCRGLAVGQERLLEEAGSVAVRLRDLFKSQGKFHQAWRVLILTHVEHRGRRGTFMIASAAAMVSPPSCPR